MEIIRYSAMKKLIFFVNLRTETIYYCCTPMMTSRSNQSLLTWTAIALLAATLAACQNKQEVKTQPPEIPVIEVTSTEIPITSDFVGQTYGYFDIAIRARVEGFLEGMHFNEGTRVRKGQLLYSIDPQPFEAEVAEARSRLAQAKTRLVRAENDLNRVRPLAEVNAVSQRDLDAAIAERDAAEAEVDAAEAGVTQARIQLGYTRIHAPINGIIGLSEAKVGDFVGRDPNSIVLNTVSRLDTILVRFSITESQYLTLRRFEQQEERSSHSGPKPGLELILADGSTHPYKGKVDFGDRQVDPTTGTLRLQASFPNPEGLVRPGQFARIRAVITVLENGIMIPQRCIKEIQGIFQVYVVNEDNEVEIRRVQTGPKKGNMWIILEGLKPGEKVVLEGIQQARTGFKIKPVVQEFEYIEAQN